METIGAAPTGQAEQNGFGLVIERVAEKHQRRPRLDCRGLERRVSRTAGRGLRAAIRAHGDRTHDDGIQSQFACLRGRSRGDLCGPGL